MDYRGVPETDLMEELMNLLLYMDPEFVIESDEEFQKFLGRSNDSSPTIFADLVYGCVCGERRLQHNHHFTPSHLISSITHLNSIPPLVGLLRYSQHHTFCSPFCLFADALVTFEFSAEQELVIREKYPEMYLTRQLMNIRRVGKESKPLSYYLWRPSAQRETSSCASQDVMKFV